MAVTRTRLPREGNIQAPVREDLGPYPLAALMFTDDKVVWADTHAELVAELSGYGDDYLSLGDPCLRQALRGHWMVACQVHLSAYIASEAQVTGEWGTLTDREREVLLGRRTLDEQPHDFGVEHLVGVDLWSAAVPLVVLVGTGRAEWPVVTDNDSLVVLDVGGHGPEAEEAAIHSLAASGYLTLWTASVVPEE